MTTYTVYMPTLHTVNAVVRPSAIDEINSYRRYHGVHVLTQHDGLMASAQEFAVYMRDNTRFGHAPDWLERIIPHYPDWQALAELLAAGYPDAASAMEALYRSPSHGAAMVSDLYNEIGVGYATGGNRYGFWWCVHLGSRNIGQRGIRRTYAFYVPGDTISAIGDSRLTQ